MREHTGVIYACATMQNDKNTNTDWPENIKQTFIFDVRFLHREQNGGKFESKHQIYYGEQK